jgi:hypothetical protein
MIIFVNCALFTEPFSYKLYVKRLFRIVSTIFRTSVEFQVCHSGILNLSRVIISEVNDYGIQWV